MDRKKFIGSLAAGGLGLPLVIKENLAAETRHIINSSNTDTSVKPASDYSIQRLHYDAQTNPEGVEYYFLGNGKVSVALQHVSGDALKMNMTPLGLLIWNPQQFSRKWSTYLFHPEWGLKREMLSVRAGDKSYQIDTKNLEVHRRYESGIPVVEVRWKAGPYTVSERYWVMSDEPVLVRDVELHNPTRKAVPVSFSTALYYNHVLFTDFRSDTDSSTLKADGYGHIELFAQPEAHLNDRYLSVDAGSAPPGKSAKASLIYVIGKSKEDITPLNIGAQWNEAKRYWNGFTDVTTPDEGYNKLYQAARDGMRAVVSESGRFDAAVWEYNMEWTMDSSMVTLGAIYSGQFELAESLLDNMITRLSNKKGIMAHSSRFRDNMETELNQQGAILGALWTYWAWTGDLDLVRRHWAKIKKIAEFPLTPKYLHESGLVHANIEFFERGSGMGILPGFAISHQSFIAWGLEKAAILARKIGDHTSAKRWSDAGAKMHDAMLHHPKFSLINKGVFIKRRLLDGKQQYILRPEVIGTDSLPVSAPLATHKEPYLDPDICLVFPIIFGQISPEDPVAKATIKEVRKLWNKRMGGYYRYNPASEPEEPGSWAFPTAIVGEALAEVGDFDGVQEVMDWFLNVQGAAGGSYFEFYADQPRPVPPLPPLGIIPWAWGEISNLFVHYLMGARVDNEGEHLIFKPHLTSKCATVNGKLKFRGKTIEVNIQRKGGERKAVYNGKNIKWTPEGFVLPEKVEDGKILISV